VPAWNWWAFHPLVLEHADLREPLGEEVVVADPRRCGRRSAAPGPPATRTSIVSPGPTSRGSGTLRSWGAPSGRVHGVPVVVHPQFSRRIAGDVPPRNDLVAGDRARVVIQPRFDLIRGVPRGARWRAALLRHGRRQAQEHQKRGEGSHHAAHYTNFKSAIDNRPSALRDGSPHRQRHRQSRKRIGGIVVPSQDRARRNCAGVDEHRGHQWPWCVHDQ
jgi:hypothetical protein